MKTLDAARRQHLLNMKADFLKAMAHPSRVLVVEALEQGERCVCELQEIVGADMSTVSKHLSVLKNAGIVAAEKRGLNVYYRLVAGCVSGFLSCIEDMIVEDARERTRVAKACRRA